MKPNTSSKKRLIPMFVILAVLIVLAIATPTIAYYIQSTVKSENQFEAAESNMPNVISKEGDNGTEVYVEVENKGYPVYVRAYIIVTWQTEAGAVYYTKPSSTDYTLTINDTDWTEIGGCYYYTEPVESGGKTENLINSFKPAEDADAPSEEYFLNIEVIAQTIQAVGSTDSGTFAWKDAWGIDLDKLSN